VTQALAAERERNKALVDAATAWRSDYDTLPREDADHDLADAIDVYLASRPLPQTEGGK
jgi:hypothetical protein